MAANIEDIAHNVNRMNELRKQGHHDIIIHIEEKQFPCHRHLMAAACPTLQPMLLKGNWHCEKPTVSGVAPEMFEMIVQYVYTGVINLTANNALKLLKVADYLSMDRLMKLCVEMLKISCPVNDLLEAYEFASHLKDVDLADNLEKTIARKSNLLRVDEGFLSLSFEVFESICIKMQKIIDCEGNRYYYCCENYLSPLRSWSKCPTCKKSLDGAIVYLYSAAFYLTVANWIRANILERVDYLYILDKYDKPTNVTLSEDLKILLEYHRSELNKRIEENAKSADGKLVLYILQENEIDNLVKLSNDNEWSHSKKFSMVASQLETTTKNRQVFYLSYNICKNENKFWIENHKTVEFLNIPPLIVSDYKLASAKDIIYLYDSTEKSSSPAEPKRKKTEITNLYSYVEGKDQWFTETGSPKQFYHSYFVTLDNSLYLIGGTTEYQNLGPSQKFVQRYDPRAAKWDVISEEGEADLLLTGGACVYENKIYVCSKFEQMGDNVDNTNCNLKFFTFDTRINKWTVEDHNLEKRFETSVLIPFGNKLWAFSQNPQHGYRVYDLNEKSWNKEELLLDELKNFSNCKIGDACVVEKL